jgi:hypothetical protein
MIDMLVELMFWGNSFDRKHDAHIPHLGAESNGMCPE